MESKPPLRSALVSCMEEGLVMLGKHGIQTPAQIRLGVVNEGRFGYVRKEWNQTPAIPDRICFGIVLEPITNNYVPLSFA